MSKNDFIALYFNCGKHYPSSLLDKAGTNKMDS